MLLAIDIGNTSVTMGLYKSETLGPRWRLASDDERTSDEYGILLVQLLERAGVIYDFVDGRGRAALSQLLSAVHFGDYVSGYLAMLYKVDPTPVPVIDYLKQQLEKG